MATEEVLSVDDVWTTMWLKTIRPFWDDVIWKALNSHLARTDRIDNVFLQAVN